MYISRGRAIRHALRLMAAIALSGLPLIAPHAMAQSQVAGPAVGALRLVVGGLAEPIYVTGVDDGSGRLFVVEKAGVIRIVQSGEVLPEPFLDISDRVDASGLERGMLGLAFHPDFARNGLLYVTHVPRDGAWALEQFTVSANPNRVDPASARQLIFLPREGHYGGHYGGMLAFGPDGYLYASIGDGGGAFDPFDHAQNLETLHGSILRLEVDGAGPYSVPDDNPFTDDSEARPEIWHYGLRNPWRFSFDRETGEMYIGDVGHVEFEEINYAPAGSPGAINYGWPEMEGAQCSDDAPDCDPSEFTPPIHTYSHVEGCTVIGGYVYRWHPVSRLYGRYIFGDYCDGLIWSLERGDGGAWEREVLLETDFNISSFGEDASGRLYVTDVTGGGVYEILDPGIGDVPVIDQLSQRNIVIGGAACHLDIVGSGFQEGAAVRWNDEERESEWIDDRRLRIAIDPRDLDEPGSVRISVRDPGSEPGISNEARLEIIGGLVSDGAMAAIWQRNDQPVLAGETARGWLWGPQALTCPMLEPYAASPGGKRAVQYFDKGRLEVTSPDDDPASAWYVTSGLLASEMITGRVQLGDDILEARSPANINVAGDPGDPDGPTYATFRERLNDPPQPAGSVLTKRIDRAGAVIDTPNLAIHGVSVAHVDDVTNHGIARPFWELMNGDGLIWDGEVYVEARLFENPYFATGRPITEAYWAEVLVAGTPRLVLIQCFERRCLTYTPDNPDGWKVETGNAGQHYYDWRYRLAESAG